jgi:protein AbiQ
MAVPGIELLDNKIRNLTQEFYNDHSAMNEILINANRPYCVMILTVDGLDFAVPFRTNIGHNHSYLFTGSPRGNNSGVDFSKAIVLTDRKYLGNETMIENHEYSMFINNKDIILRRFKKFIENYKKWHNDPPYYHQENLFRYSSLQYFHSELGI